MIYKITSVVSTYVDAQDEEEAMELYEDEDFVSEDKEVSGISKSSMREALS